MPSFLTEIDNKFNFLLKKKAIARNDLIELKTFIINIYENDTMIDIVFVSEIPIINFVLNMTAKCYTGFLNMVL